MTKSKLSTAFKTVSSIIVLLTLMLSYMVPIFLGILLIGNIPWTLPLWLLWLVPITLVLSVLSMLFRVLTGGKELGEPGKVLTRTEKLIYEILGAITLGFFIGATGLGIWAVYLSAILLTFKLILGATLVVQSLPKTEPSS